MRACSVDPAIAVLDWTLWRGLPVYVIERLVGGDWLPDLFGYRDFDRACRSLVRRSEPSRISIIWR